MNTILRAIIEASKVDPKKALRIVLMAIGVMTVALEALREVAKALAGF